MSVDVKYRATATATGGRDGQAATKDGTFSVKLATPKELGGAGGPGNNPEQLFAAGYSACFIGAMKFVASQGGPAKVPADTSCDHHGRHRSPLGGRVRSRGRHGGVAAGVDKAAAEALVEKAHHICPYSNSIRGNVEVRTRVV